MSFSSTYGCTLSVFALIESLPVLFASAFLFPEQAVSRVIAMSERVKVSFFIVVSMRVGAARVIYS